MLFNEPGVLPGSDHYTFSDEGVNTEYHMHLSMCGHFHCEREFFRDRRYYEPLLVLCVLDGEFLLTYEGRDYIAKRGEIVAIDCQKPHYYRSGKSCEFIHLHFSGGQSHGIMAELNRSYGAVFSQPGNGYIRDQVFGILSMFRNNQPVEPVIMSAMLYDILCHLYPTRLEGGGKSSNYIVTRAVEYMKYHLSSPITVEDIAGAVHLSKHHFSRLFREQFGDSPYNYLLGMRIDMAKHLLKTTGDTVREVAGAVGYRSEMGFVMQFTERVGISPGRYRKYPF